MCGLSPPTTQRQMSGGRGTALSAGPWNNRPHTIRRKGMTMTDMGGMCECGWDGDGEPIVTFEHRNLKVRKNHKCSECGYIIEQGQMCEIHRYLYDGEFYRDYTCLSCVGISRDFCCGQRGELVYIFQETYGWDYREVPSDV